MIRLITSFIAAAMAITAESQAASIESFRLAGEYSLDGFGGIPFPCDLDNDGHADVVWLQSPGMFYSKVFDTPPYTGRFSEEERNHFCLTATDASGKVRWRVGEPWGGNQPFVSHSAERALDMADIDGDGAVEIVCVRRDEIIIIDGKSGEVEKAVKAPADNPQIVRIGRSGPAAMNWIILVKNAERSYPPHEYANPAWFYTSDLNLLKTSDYLGAGHTPLVSDMDGDGFDEYIIGFNLVDHTLETVWRFQPVEENLWDAGEMHADDIVVGDLGGKRYVIVAASDTAYVLDATDGHLVWKRTLTHPQHCQIGHFHPDLEGTQVFIHNKRAELQLFDPQGTELWTIMPPKNFPLGAAAPCRRQGFHVFNPTTVLEGMGPEGTDLLIFTDGGWPYVINGRGERCLEFPHTPNIAQDWGEAPGRPDDYGYGYYARVADFDGDGAVEVLINDRRFAWLYETTPASHPSTPPRSDARVLHVDFEGYVDGLVGVLDAGVRWLGDPFTNIKQNKTEIENDPVRAYAGRRCAHVLTDQPEQRGRIVLQRRFDASEVSDEAVEFVFRPALENGADLHDFVVWSGLGYRSGRAGVTLYANGSAADGTYSLDIEAGGKESSARIENVVKDLWQSEWNRFLLARNREQKTVDLWIGPPDHERWIGCYEDLNPGNTIGRAEFGDLSKEQCVGSGYWDDIRIGRVLEHGGAPASPEITPDMRNNIPVITYPLPVGKEKQLFLDDIAVETMEGLQRTFHTPTKRPENPILIPKEPWEKNGRFFVPFDVLPEGTEGKLRVWYGCYRKSENKLTFTCVADSPDGLKWERLNLGLFDFEGSRENNIVWQGRGVKPNFDPRDPDPSRRYKGMTRVNGFTPLFSPDGIYWTMADAPAIEQAYDASTVHWEPIGGKWIASCKIFKDGKRARGYAESRDYLNWSDTYPMLYADENDAPQDELYAMRIFRYEGLYLGLLKVYHVATDRCDIQLAVSRNSQSWERPYRTAFLANSAEPGSYDYGNLDEAGDPIRMGNALWFFYAGRSILHQQQSPDTNGSLCATTLRLDGFVSLDARGQEGGVLTTKPLSLEGETLFINANAADGRICVEIIDEHGAIVEPFSLDNSIAVKEDGIRLPLHWGGDARIGNLKGKAIRIRFHVLNGDLYAFWTE
ncbi:MAG TPA: hypothetical protein PLI09_23400 [Candidatus Hydrogenedentes bacterium]|nr:hypothetical protein [Candidatus Hydrogenedentota bacterium]